MYCRRRGSVRRTVVRRPLLSLQRPLLPFPLKFFFLPSTRVQRPDALHLKTESGCSLVTVPFGAFYFASFQYLHHEPHDTNDKVCPDERAWLEATVVRIS
ncbi:hypothetical protein Mapa_011098 [Marchantia paleacea]|nr:hypothetical protein Mapa_011098 [Marchantia paleacea]